MVIAVCSFALDLSDGRVGTCIGSAGPTPIRAREAEAFADRLVRVSRYRDGRSAPQIRNRGTIGGTSALVPAGDALPPLYASGAESSSLGARRAARAGRGLHHRSRNATRWRRTS